MHKAKLTVALLTGFLLGSRMGHQPYEILEAGVHRFVSRPDVKELLDSLRVSVRHRSTDMVGKVQSRVKPRPPIEPWSRATALTYPH